MAEYLKILGQQAPSSGVSTDLYTVPSNYQTVISKVYVCNRGATQASFRISIAANGAALANNQYIYYDTPLTSGDTFVVQGGITIDSTDKVRVYSSTSDLTFIAFGSEMS